MDQTHNYYNSSYRYDVARWGGQTFTVPDNLPRNMDVSKLGETNRAIGRALKTCTTTSTIRTPESTTRATYVNHFPKTRSIDGPTYSQVTPRGVQPPKLGDETLFRPSTEYGSRYTRKYPEPFVSDKTRARCISPDNTFARRGATTQHGNRWESTYRNDYCNKVSDLHTSGAVTFRNFTGLR